MNVGMPTPGDIKYVKKSVRSTFRVLVKRVGCSVV